MMTDPLLGQTIGNYEIVSKVGRGGMATVYRARQVNMQRDVALKIMSADLAEDPQFVARFEREARVIANLQHPRILPVHDFGHEGEVFFLVMRLVEGESLYHSLLQGALPLIKASKYVGQIAEALDYAHAQGVVHRDLKPNNVLIDEWDNLYLMDFGLAKMLAASQNLTQTGAVLGTPAYMAPEQWRGGAVDARTDVYALGVIIYEMISGRTPFESDTPFTLMYKHLNEAPPTLRDSRPSLPQAVEDVIFKALAKDPEERYPSAGALAQAFADMVRVAGSLVIKERLDTEQKEENAALTPATTFEPEAAEPPSPEAPAIVSSAPAVEQAPPAEVSSSPEPEIGGVKTSESAAPASARVLPPDEIVPPPAHIAPPPRPIPVPVVGARAPARSRKPAISRAEPPPSGVRDLMDRVSSSSALQQMLEAVDHSVEIAVEKVAQSVAPPASSPDLGVMAPRASVPVNAPAFEQVRQLLPAEEQVIGVLDVRGTVKWQTGKRLLVAGLVMFLLGATMQAGFLTLVGMVLLGFLGVQVYRTQRGTTGRYYLGFTPEQIVLLPRNEYNVPQPDEAYLAPWSQVERLRLASRYVLLDAFSDDENPLHLGAVLPLEGDGGLGDQTAWLSVSPITRLISERGFEARE